MEYIIYSDESDREGKFFGHFYGAALVRSQHINQVEGAINNLKNELNLKGEIKWSKVPSHEIYFERYKQIIDLFFDFVKRDIVKVRIMFTQNINIPVGLTMEQKENEFLLLYYQFLKGCFGFKYCDEVVPNQKIKLKFFFDDLPISQIDAQRFKDYIFSWNFNEFLGEAFELKYENMTEVKSKNHSILQCLDVVLGSMCFRLNNKHKEKPEGRARRSKGTIYKEKMYKHIRNHIEEIYPNFNCGVSTGNRGYGEGYIWKQPYRHWLFVPRNHVVDPDPEKRKR